MPRIPFVPILVAVAAVAIIVGLIGIRTGDSTVSVTFDGRVRPPWRTA